MFLILVFCQIVLILCIFNFSILDSINQSLFNLVCIAFPYLVSIEAYFTKQLIKIILPICIVTCYSYRLPIIYNIPITLKTCTLFFETREWVSICINFAFIRFPASLLLRTIVQNARQCRYGIGYFNITQLFCDCRTRNGCKSLHHCCKFKSRWKSSHMDFIIFCVQYMT